MPCPKIIHQVWIGDQSKRPSRMMQTWKDLNPSCEYYIWTEESLKEFDFINQDKIDTMSDLNGKCDIMRFEILFRYGGFLVDADSECVNTLDDFFFMGDRFSCYENEKRSKLVSEGHMACKPNDPFFAYCILELGKVDMVGRQGWEVTGNQFLTDMIDKYAERFPWKIYPSWWFIPKHAASQPWNNLEYTGGDKIYAKHHWGSTFGLYRPGGEMDEKVY